MKRSLKYVSWFFIVLFAFNFYAYEIEQINSAVRLFLKTGSLKIRNFDDKGLPISQSPRLGEFLSPFYVVHYGLIYSDGLMGKGVHWRKDPSLIYWNVQPPKNIESTNIAHFKNSADWVVSNIEEYKGASHLIYDFDWPYSNYPNGGLSAPWWSGLTDGYAIILLLRAYDYFGKVEYYDSAENLYRSVLLETNLGGSLSTLNGCPWIEEYVDPQYDSSEMSYVLNGMVYATYGIEAYEKYLNVKNGFSSILYSCIEKNIGVFDLSGWSAYDAIGNSANIKYHNINYILLSDLLESGKVAKTSVVHEYYNSWRFGYLSPGLFYVIKGPFSYSYIHFILSFFFVFLSPVLTIASISCFRKNQ